MNIALLVAGENLRELVQMQIATAEPGDIDWPNHAMTLGEVFPQELVSPTPISTGPMSGQVFPGCWRHCHSARVVGRLVLGYP